MPITDAAVARIGAIYEERRDGAATRSPFIAGEPFDRLGPIEACYPFLGIQVGRQSLNLDARRSFGALHDPASTGPR